MVYSIGNDDEEGLRATAELAAARHPGLKASLPFLPARDSSYFLPKLRWVAERGKLLGLREGSRLVAYSGSFGIPGFRNVGAAGYSPEWCHGRVDDLDAYRAYSALYREQLAHWHGLGARVHAVSVYASEPAAETALALLGFGRIVMDAANPASVLPEPGGAPDGLKIRRAHPGDGGRLCSLNAALAGHIRAEPVCMPLARGMDAGSWERWLDGGDALAFLALDGDGRAVGYIKAEGAQDDVSDAVRDPGTLAISGMYVLPQARGRGIGGRLLAELSGLARNSGRPVVSVDCETTNPEAYSFWSRFFQPVSWSLERRT